MDKTSYQNMNEVTTLRKKLNITQKSLAKLIGVSPRTISRWENNEVTPMSFFYERLTQLYELYRLNNRKKYGSNTKLDGARASI